MPDVILATNGPILVVVDRSRSIIDDARSIIVDPKSIIDDSFWTINSRISQLMNQFRSSLIEIGSIIVLLAQSTTKIRSSIMPFRSFPKERASSVGFMRSLQVSVGE